ncbi:hypothetical protein AYM40_30205 [Paraburkholderia phytofirmans OLGA172]|uniref:Uncharacterized protein n=1 Tax=Paraburkholderia phytofirmans OLGA172 TaxID=1417228 RepID=A0A160FU19_9BURK|nr:hypothetical protein [Paraburkholderia phytofirmans]ANB76484.1 hypothetical protein AYM40_30205 [Paraburkholderia phytofirmans OLGA172]
MNHKPIAALLIAASTLLSVPAFASGYGPAPFYRPSVGAPASQRGQSAQTVAAERQTAGNATAASSYGGAAPFSSESGERDAVATPHGIYEGH